MVGFHMKQGKYYFSNTNNNYIITNNNFKNFEMRNFSIFKKSKNRNLNVFLIKGKMRVSILD